MNLAEMFYKVKEHIATVDFNNLWEGFRPLKYALYNDNECYFNGKYIPKTDEFLANTSIKFNGEMIAIWNMKEDIDPIIMTSKMIHEMYHGYQSLKEESRFPNEFEAVLNYKYNPQNLGIKLLENKLIVELLESFDKDKFEYLLSLMKYRYNHFKYEFMYELKVEQIEGSANNVELNALKQLSKVEYQKKLQKMKENILNPKNLFPVRVISYDIGALRMEILKINNIEFNESFNDMLYIEGLLMDVEEASNFDFDVLNDFVVEFNNEKNMIVENALDKNEIIAENTQLLGFNVYNALSVEKYIISRYFVMYGDENQSIVQYGDFVIELLDGRNINKIYKI